MAIEAGLTLVTWSAEASHHEAAAASGHQRRLHRCFRSDAVAHNCQGLTMNAQFDWIRLPQGSMVDENVVGFLFKQASGLKLNGVGQRIFWDERTGVIFFALAG